MISNHFELATQRASWYEGTRRDGQFGRAGRHSRTIGSEGIPRETGGANLRPIAEEFKSRRPFTGRNL